MTHQERFRTSSQSTMNTAELQKLLTPMMQVFSSILNFLLHSFFCKGPNAVIYLLEKDVSEVLGLIEHYFPSSKSMDEYIRGNDKKDVGKVAEELKSGAKGMPMKESDGLNYILCTRVGDGCRVLDNKDSLADEEGYPKK